MNPILKLRGKRKLTQVQAAFKAGVPPLAGKLEDEMSAVRNDQGIVVDDLTERPAAGIVVMDAGDNEIYRGHPDALETLEIRFEKQLLLGRYTIVTLDS